MKTNRTHFILKIGLWSCMVLLMACSNSSEERTRGSVTGHENSTASPSSIRESPDTEEEGKEKAAQTAVRTLFDAWEKLDLELYLSVWSPYAEKYNGNKKQTFEELKAKRESLFPRLSKVSVDYYVIQDTEVMNKQAVVTVRYSMTFHFKNGKIIKEEEVTEVYTLAFDEAKGKWFIQENRDYIG